MVEAGAEKTAAMASSGGGPPSGGPSNSDPSNQQNLKKGGVLKKGAGKGMPSPAEYAQVVEQAMGLAKKVKDEVNIELKKACALQKVSARKDALENVEKRYGSILQDLQVNALDERYGLDSVPFSTESKEFL